MERGSKAHRCRGGRAPRGIPMRHLHAAFITRRSRLALLARLAPIALLAWLVSLALAGQVAAQSDSASHLEKEAAKLDIHFGTGSTVGAKIESKLSPRTRAALNAWAPVASRLSLTVAVPQKAEALVLGLAPVDTVA